MHNNFDRRYKFAYNHAVLTGKWMKFEEQINYKFGYKFLMN